jgi:excisionase family DNA binding protein
VTWLIGPRVTESARLLLASTVAIAHLVSMKTTQPTLSGLEPLMSIEELSEYLHVPVRTLYDWRLAGRGPCAIHIGRQLRYFVSDVHEWLVSATLQNGADPTLENEATGSSVSSLPCLGS